MNTDKNSMLIFLRELGHQIIQTRDAAWYEVQPGVLLSFPYHRLVEPSEQEIRDLMRLHKLRAIRFPTKICNYGFMSCIIVNANTEYDFGSLHQKSRNQTRRALENCKVEQVTFDYLFEHGLGLNRDTAERQGRQSQYADAAYWRTYCEAAKRVEGVSAWGAFVEGQLGSFLVAVEVGDWVEWVVNHSSNALRNKYPNNALVFTAAQYFFKKRGLKGICYGLGSLEPTPDLDHFKERMGWRFEPVKQRIVFSRGFSAMAAIAREPVLKLVSLAFPKNYTVRKTAAMFRHYRNQTIDMPAIEQNALNDNRDKVDICKAAEKPVKQNLDTATATVSETQSTEPFFNIVPFNSSHIEQVVAVHIRAFPGFFLTFLGPAFLTKFYKSFTRDPLAIAFVAVSKETGNVIGFAVGAMDPEEFFRRLFVRRWWAFFCASFHAMLRKPSIVPRIFRAMYYRGNTPKGLPRALLSSISADPAVQGRGIGKALAQAWIIEARRRGGNGCYLITDAINNDRVNETYRKMGWQLESCYKTPEGREMNRYIYDLKNEP